MKNQPTIQKAVNEALKHGLLECKTRSFTMRLTVYWNLVDIQCNLNQQNIKFKTTKKQDNKDYEHDRKQYFNGKIYLEDFPI